MEWILFAFLVFSFFVSFVTSIISIIGIICMLKDDNWDMEQENTLIRVGTWCILFWTLFYTLTQLKHIL